MPSRRQIRETAIQLLYCVHLRGGAATAELRESFWPLITESSRRQLLTATRRSVRRFDQGRPQRLAELAERLPAARAAIGAEPEAMVLADALAQVEAAEHRLSRAFEALERVSLDGGDAEVAARLEPPVAELFAADRDARRARREFLEAAADYPSLLPALDPLCGTCRKLDRGTAGLAQLADAEAPGDEPELEPIRRAREDITKLRERAGRLADQVLERLDTVDARLAAIIENFSPERLDLVDRSILRLGAWEILFDPEVPNPVAINEAVDIAKRFGTTESAGFVNGVLDRLARDG